MYPGISDTDLARSLLMGDEGSQYLKTRIGQAEILAEADTAGLSLQTSAAELEARGVNRDQAAKGLSKIAEQRGGYQEAARIYGDNVDAAGLQKELESENLLGQTSARTKRLASQARGAFAEQTGIRTGSLSRKSSGQI
jgi:hypothetical protein